MRFVLKLIFWLLILSPFALTAATWFALSDQPLVEKTAQLSHTDIARAKHILKKNDPRWLPAGSVHDIRINEKDLNLATNFLLQKVGKGGAKIRMNSGSVTAVGSVRIPKLPIKPFLNIQLQIEDQQGIPKISGLKIGQLSIPSFIAEFATSQLMQRLYQSGEYQLASDVVKKLAMRERYLVVTYEWNPALINQARETLLKPGDKAALSAYYEKLIQLQQQGIKSGSLTAMLKPMFNLAEARSRDHDPVTENRSLLAILGAWASEKNVTRLVPDAKTRPGRFHLKLEGRTDFGQHFLTSAALAANGDAKLADAVGLFKEIADSQGGSGFSFTDIAADRAGTRFGELATQSKTQAREVQQLLSAGVRETDIMPKARDLPEGMSAAKFKQRFGGVGSPAYDNMMADIERRIARCRLYRQ